MTRTVNRCSQLRAAVAQISLLIQRWAGMEWRPDCDPMGVMAPFSSGRRAVLSTLLLLVAVRLLSRREQLSVLVGSESVAKDGALIHSAENMNFAMEQLYLRLCTFAPPEIAPVLPEPVSLPSDWLADLQGQVGSLDNLFAHADETTLGDIYQWYSADRRSLTKGHIQSPNKLLTADMLISFSQLYTPMWVTEFLLQNSVIPQWQGSGNHAGLTESLRYFLKLPDQRGGLEASALKIIDPACGAGNFLVNAFDLLMKLHLAEGSSSKEAVGTILKQNLAGADIDPVSLWVASLALLVKCLSTEGYDGGSFKRVALVEGTGDVCLGSLRRDWETFPGHLLSEKYHAVVTNPPYIGRKLMSRELKAALKPLYPDSYHDLCAAFISRGLELMAPGGFLAVITQVAVLYLPSYSKLRQRLVESNQITAVVEAGVGVFPMQGGEKVNSALIIVRAGDASSPAESPIDAGSRAAFFDIAVSKGKEEALSEMVATLDQGAHPGLHWLSPATFRAHRGYAFNYRCPSPVLNFLSRQQRLESIADIRQGLATTDNQRFVRYWWDVLPESLGIRWLPYVKGAGGERWFSPVLQVVDWGADGASIKEAVADAYPYLKGKVQWVVKNESYYFRQGLTFSFVNSGEFGVRRLPTGCVFDVAGSALFSKHGEDDLLLAYLNSSFVRSAAAIHSPTINFQVGDLKQLPVLNFDEPTRHRLAVIAEQLHTIKRRLASFDETAPEMQDSVDLDAIRADARSVLAGYIAKEGHDRQLMGQLETEIDTLVWALLEKITDRASLSALSDWMMVEPGVKRRAALCGDAQNLARAVVFKCLLAGLAQPSEGSGRARLGRLMMIESPESLCPSLGVSANTATWLEMQLGMPLFDYVKTRFLSDHCKRFHNSPLVFVYRMPESSALLVFTSWQVRRMQADSWFRLQALRDLQQDCRTSGAPERGFSDLLTGFDRMLSTLLSRLPEGPDWTGRDLLEIYRLL